MRTALPNAARDTVAPTLQKAQDTLTDSVLPALRDALVIARERGTELLDHDVTHEARRRGAAVVKAAKGDVVVPPPGRWRFGLGMVAIGTGLGFAVAWVVRRLGTPVESYTHTMPVPSGTDGGVTAGTANGQAAGGTDTGGAAPAGTPAEDIDLRSGAPTGA